MKRWCCHAGTGPAVARAYATLAGRAAACIIRIEFGQTARHHIGDWFGGECVVLVATVVSRQNPVAALAKHVGDRVIQPHPIMPRHPTVRLVQPRC